MANVEGRIDEPDVSFDADAADRQSGVKGESTPVVIVGVDRFLWVKREDSQSAVAESETRQRKRKRKDVIRE